MKLLALVIAVSAATNVALVAAFVSKPTLAPPSVRGFFEFGSASPSRASAEASAAKSAQRPTGDRVAAASSKADLWARLHTDDLPALIARLRAAGFPPTLIRAIADAEIQRRFAPRLEEIRRSVNETPYWRGDPGSFGVNRNIYEQMTQLSRDRAKALRELIGQDAFAYSGMDPTEAQRRQFGNLAPGKIDLVQRINDDYAEMSAQIRAAMQGITLPEDREKLALLEREKRADLASILTPEELADYEMRTSPITSRLRTALTVLDASEAEFQQIYAAHKPFAETLYPTSSGGMVVFTSDLVENRRAATEKINAQLKQTLGDARFAEYQRAADREFQQLYQLTRSENVSYDTLVRAYDSRQPTAEASMKIANDPNLSVAEKTAALKQLAETTRTQVLSTLGPGTGPVYADSARWLTALQQGRAFSIMPDGNISTRMISAPRPVTPPPAK